MNKLTLIIEAALMGASKPLALKELRKMFRDEDMPDKGDFINSLTELKQHYDNRGVELVESASGYRFRVPEKYSSRIGRIMAEKPVKLSSALLETLAIIAYRQPVTRAEIEDIRGVSVNSSIIKNLHERKWITTMGTREVAGRPVLYGTTGEFLDDFGLTSLENLSDYTIFKK